VDCVGRVCESREFDSVYYISNRSHESNALFVWR